MPPLDGLFHLQGHRGARGLKPENTLPSFEAALDAGVSSIETDLHLTHDGAVVLCHDPVAELSLAEVRSRRADRNTDPVRFPTQDAVVTPLARGFAGRHGFDAFAVPTLADLFRFAATYAGPYGAEAGKSPAQRERAGRVGFDLEIKRVPFHPDRVGDGFPGLLEEKVIEYIADAGVADRTTVRSFDHRSVRCLRALEPRLTGAVLIAHTAPVALAEIVRAADARIYCPSYDFVDEALVRQAHAAGVRVLPWTVNDPEHWKRLIEWGVDGLTTDYPDRLADWLRAWNIPF